MTRHLTYTGIYAGQLLCPVNKSDARDHSDSFVHAGYAPDWMLTDAETCDDCINEWNSED